MAWRQIAETFETGVIVIVDEAIEEGISVGMRCEAAMSDAAFRLPTHGVSDAAVEAFDEAVGLRPVGSSETVVDLALGAEAIEGMLTGWIVGLVPHVDGKAISELTAIVGEDGMNPMWKWARKRLRNPAEVLASRLGWISR